MDGIEGGELLLDKHAAVHDPFMHDVAPVVDEGQALCADFIGSDDLTAAFSRAKQSQTNGGTEQGEKYSVLALYAMQTCFELREGSCVHDPSITRITLRLAIYFCFHAGVPPENVFRTNDRDSAAKSSPKFLRIFMVLLGNSRPRQCTASLLFLL